MRTTFFCMFPAVLILMAMVALPAQAKDFHDDFEAGAREEWSSSRTIEVEGDTVLGPINNRNKRFPDKARLKLKKMPKADYTLRFELVTLGNWDSEGKRADVFQVSVDKEPLLTVTEYPCGLSDEAELLPKGTPGAVRIGNRYLGNCRLPFEVTIPAAAIEEGTLKLDFTAKVSGRRSEFWALDNVSLIPAD